MEHQPDHGQRHRHRHDQRERDALFARDADRRPARKQTVDACGHAAKVHACTGGPLHGCGGLSADETALFRMPPSRSPWRPPRARRRFPRSRSRRRRSTSAPKCSTPTTWASSRSTASPSTCSSSTTARRSHRPSRRARSISRRATSSRWRPRTIRACRSSSSRPRRSTRARADERADRREELADQTAKDLNGKTIGITGVKNITHISTMPWMDANGGDPSAKYIELKFSEMAAAVASGRIDAGVTAEPDLSVATQAATAASWRRSIMPSHRPSSSARGSRRAIGRRRIPICWPATSRRSPKPAHGPTRIRAHRRRFSRSTRRSRASPA